jgi:hypothetical protein
MDDDIDEEEDIYFKKIKKYMPNNFTFIILEIEKNNPKNSSDIHKKYEEILELVPLKFVEIIRKKVNILESQKIETSPIQGGFKINSKNYFPNATYPDDIFPEINSSKLIYTVFLTSITGSSIKLDGFKGKYRKREDLRYIYCYPPIISASYFVPINFIEHLMRKKRDKAIGTKYIKNDKDSKITNMEACLHTFVTPICIIYMNGDYKYTDRHGTIKFQSDQMRPVILSASIQLDFETMEVFAEFLNVPSDIIEGIEKPPSLPFIDQQDSLDIASYETNLKKYMYYHLFSHHKYASYKKIINFNTTPKDIIDTVINGINQSNLNIHNLFFFSHCKFNEKITISLLALFNVYRYQLTNEFVVFEKYLKQGYIYTINPPVIFATQLNSENINEDNINYSVVLLNIIQMLNIWYLSELHIKYLKIIAFDDYNDKITIGLYRKLFINKGIKIMSKKDLLDDNNNYIITEKYALIIHNNSDAFGQNIETEADGGSLDGAIGANSSAAWALNRNMKGLCNYIIKNNPIFNVIETNKYKIEIQSELHYEKQN